MVNKNQEEKESLKQEKGKASQESKRRMNAFGQKKQAKKLAQDIIYHNAARLQLLGGEVKEEKLVTNKEEAERAYLTAQNVHDSENDQCASGSLPFKFRILKFDFEH